MGKGRGKGKAKHNKVCGRKDCMNNAGKDNFYCGLHMHNKVTKGVGFKPKPECHKGQNSVFIVDDIEVFAGGRNRSGGWQKMNPPAHLAMGPSETLGSWGASKTEVPEGWSCGESLKEVTPHMISLDWPDFSIPKVGKEFWYALIQDIKDNNIKRISCQCAGGHGRTGVQLAILAYLLSPAGKKRDARWPDAAVLTKWVRDAHCHHAVEAKSQQEYIAMVCGIPLGEMLIAEVSYGFYGDYGSVDYGSNQWKDIADVNDDEIMTLAEVAEDEVAALKDEHAVLVVPVEEESCPVCTGEVDNEYCLTCHTDLLNWEEDTTLHESYCPLCDGEQP